MDTYYLAVDIGASSGRHILASMKDGKMQLEEIYRFENGMRQQDGKLLWDTAHIFEEILNGMKKCRESGKIPTSMSIDTWALDYVLLDEKDEILGDTYGYRDSRTQGMEKLVYQIIPEAELYARTGIQKQSFNTIYQLMAVKETEPELLSNAHTFLMLPDYFQFLLTGNKCSEYTNATTTQLMNPVTKQWDMDLIRRLGYPEKIFLPVRLPGTAVGRLKKEIQTMVGYDCQVLLCASHDTASAVMAMPVVQGDGLYISSGTWSLMGVEHPTALCDENSRTANFTNEGGYEYRFRYLKNIMGLWMIQSVRHELNDDFSFAQLCELAEASSTFPGRVDVNDACFLAPESMTEAIQKYCRIHGQPVPTEIGELAAVIYQSLAECYGRTVKELEQNMHRHYDRIHIIGGGSNAEYLNRLTASATGRVVCAGPKEATAIGNLMAQMIEDGVFAGLGEARDCVLRSFPVKEYEPFQNGSKRV